jgi:predicted ferric reductase
VNVAVWLGSSLFLTVVFLGGGWWGVCFGVGVVGFFGGGVGQILFSRFFVLQYCCGTIALALYTWDAVYRGHKFERVTFITLVLLLAIALVGGLWLQPKLKGLHQTSYSTKVTPAEQQDAKKLFGALHGASSAVNLLVLGGLFFYFWKTVQPPRQNSGPNPFGWQ